MKKLFLIGLVVALSTAAYGQDLFWEKPYNLTCKRIETVYLGKKSSKFFDKIAGNKIGRKESISIRKQIKKNDDTFDIKEMFICKNKYVTCYFYGFAARSSAFPALSCLKK